MLHYDPDLIVTTFKLRGRNGGEPRVTGENLSACCPFPHTGKDGTIHYESVPSFGIHLQTGKYNCFSCGQRGLSLTKLAWNLGIEIPPIFRTKIGEIKEDEHGYEDDVFYLDMNPDLAEDYLISRGIENARMVTEFYNLGASDDGKIIYFPLYKKDGSIAGWAERLIDNKYRWLYQPDHLNKREFLFGLHQLPERTRTGFLVESNTDVLKLRSWNLPAVSTLGASISDWQVEAILDRFDEIIAVPQLDTPGMKWAKTVATKIYGRLPLFFTRIGGEQRDGSPVKDVTNIEVKEAFMEFNKRRQLYKELKWGRRKQ